MGINDTGATPWLRMCTFRAYGPPGSDVPREAQFAAHMWSAATVEDRVQHVRVRCAAARLDIGIVLMAVDDSKARAAGARICTAAIASAPETHGWILQTLP